MQVTTTCPEPIEALRQPQAQACKLGPGFANLDPDTQWAMVRACHESDMALLIETETRRRTLAAHIRTCE